MRKFIFLKVIALHNKEINYYYMGSELVQSELKPVEVVKEVDRIPLWERQKESRQLFCLILSGPTQKKDTLKC